MLWFLLTHSEDRKRGKNQPSCVHFLSRLKGQVKSSARILCLFYEHLPLLLQLVRAPPGGGGDGVDGEVSGGVGMGVFQFRVTVFLDSGLSFLL